MHVRGLYFFGLAFLATSVGQARLEKPINVSAVQKINHRNGKNQVVLKWEALPYSDWVTADPNIFQREVHIKKVYKGQGIKSRVIVLDGMPMSYVDEECHPAYKKIPATPGYPNCNNSGVAKLSGRKVFQYKVYHVLKILNPKTKKYLYKKAAAKPVEIAPTDYAAKVEYEGVFGRYSPNVNDGDPYHGNGSLVFGSLRSNAVDINLVNVVNGLFEFGGPYVENSFPYKGEMNFIFYEEDGYGIRKVATTAGEATGTSMLTTTIISRTSTGSGLIDCRGGQLAVNSSTIANSSGNGIYSYTQSKEQGEPGVRGSGYLQMKMVYRESGNNVNAEFPLIVTTGHNSMVLNNPEQGDGPLIANNSENPMLGKPFNCDNLADQRGLRLIGVAPGYRSSTQVFHGDMALTIKLDFN